MKKSVLVVVAWVLVLWALGFMSATGSFAPTKLASSAVSEDADVTEAPQPISLDELSPTIQNYTSPYWKWEDYMISMNRNSLLGVYSIKTSKLNSLTLTSVVLDYQIPEKYRLLVTSLWDVQYYIGEGVYSAHHDSGTCTTEKIETGFTITCSLPEYPDGTAFTLPGGSEGYLEIYWTMHWSGVWTITQKIKELDYKGGTGFINATEYTKRNFENYPILSLNASSKEAVVANGTKSTFGSFDVSFGTPDHPYTKPFIIDNFTMTIPDNLAGKIRSVSITDGKNTASCDIELGDSSFNCETRKFSKFLPGTTTTFKLSAIFTSLKKGQTYAISFSYFGWYGDDDFVQTNFENTNMNFGLTRTSKTTQCSDTDGGKIDTIKGTTKFINSKNKTVTKNDVCSTKSPFEMTEYYCKGDSVASEVRTCAARCVEGACIDRSAFLKNLIRK